MEAKRITTVSVTPITLRTLRIMAAQNETTVSGLLEKIAGAYDRVSEVLK